MVKRLKRHGKRKVFLQCFSALINFVTKAEVIPYVVGGDNADIMCFDFVILTDTTARCKTNAGALRIGATFSMADYSLTDCCLEMVKVTKAILPT